MGRETTFLLAILGVLVGAFVGVLSAKLLVPRPPTGTGPDVDPQVPLVASHDIVEPPALEPRTTSSASTAPRDPFVARANFTAPAAEEPAALPEPPAPAEHAPSRWTPPAPADAAPIADDGERGPPDVGGPSLPHDAHTPIAGTHVTGPGDTWWSIAERAYGDGRLYRALYAWNRRLDPAVSMAAGTRLDIPPRPRLAAAWPKLMP